MASKSKFSAGDRGCFTHAGPRFNPIRPTRVHGGSHHSTKKTPAVQLDREIAEVLTRPKGGHALAVPQPRRGRDLTGELARTLSRFEFIAHWLVVVTKKKENRGPLGLYVRRVGKRWQVVSPVGGGTVTFETTDPALLFDHVRRGQLGRDVRDAEEFRILAHGT